MDFLSSLNGPIAQGLIWGLLAIGVYITYKVLDYADLTVDSSLCTGGAVAVMLMLGGVNPFVAVALAGVAGMIAGFITGTLHVAFGIPPILSGILTQIALYSINMRIMGGRSNQAISVDKFPLILSLRNLPQAILVGSIFCVAIIAFLYWFFGTEVGRAIRATGNNEKMARAQGINTNAKKVIGLMLSNGLVGIAGALLAQYQGNADVNMGRGAIVIGLASVIIGGVIFDKIFKNFALRLLAVVFGSILYYIIIDFALDLGLATSDLKLVSAIIVTIFLAAPYLGAKYFPKKKTEVLK